MDKDKLKKYASYAGLGILPGLYILIVQEGFGRYGRGGSIFTIIILLFPMLGGLLGGKIAKKWWGALVGGLVLSGLIVLIVFIVALYALKYML